MPHLTLPLGALGPTLDVLVGVSQPRASALVAAGQPVPPSVTAHVLIDTGASCTCVDASVLAGLNLTPTGSVPINTPSTDTTPHPANQFDVSLTLMHPAISLALGVVPVVEICLATPGVRGLIGRDILANCIFVYDGRANLFIFGF